ncbi:MAG: hypothetical protein QOF51_3644, partial [Chloroflexota bacterium]|nr:hypothetical protein [Chloroflexota bacterium]
MSFPGFARLALTSLVLIASMSPLVAADATAQTSEVAQSATQSAILADPEAASETQSSGRLFAQTGFAVSDDQIWNYFNAHGGAAVLGDPLSRQFTLQGSTVQLFERGALQVAPGQGVRALNLIDLLPYSPVDGYQLPSVDDALVAAAPSRDASDFTARALEFVQSNVKDASGETQTGFLTLYEAAAPGRDAVAGVTMGLDLWGLPTTAAVADPDQSNVLYQRFERGFMVRDTDANTT